VLECIVRSLVDYRVFFRQRLPIDCPTLPVGPFTDRAAESSSSPERRKRCPLVSAVAISRAEISAFALASHRMRRL